MANINETLSERGSRYGDFAGHAEVTQGIKEILRGGKNYEKLTDDKREALEMIAHKMGRIVNGDPDYFDSWHDIEGYARLVSETLAQVKV